MVTREQALSVALKEASEGLVAVEDESVELANGWFFPWTSINGQPYLGSPGIIVNKESGEVLCVASAWPLQRSFWAYEAGYVRSSYNIKITSVSNHDLTLDLLAALNISVIEPEFAHGTMWKVPRFLEREEISRMISELPCFFRDVYIEHQFEEIEKARSDNRCAFELLDSDGSATPQA